MALFALLLILISLGLVILFKFTYDIRKPPVFGVYQKRNRFFWTKFIVAYFFLRLRQLFVYLKRIVAVELGYSYDGTVHIHEHDVALERKYSLGHLPSAVDAVYFNAMSKDGEAVICGIARRPENSCDAFLYVKVGKDLLLSPELPDTCLKQTTDEAGDYHVQGISIFNFIPMRTWKISYDGEMKSRSNTDNRVQVKMDLVWSAVWPFFNYDSDMSPRCMAKDMAREQWSADYFKLLKEFHQTHYEQMGFLTGTIFIDRQKHPVNMPCVRDHSFGKLRDWRTFHRYVYHFMFLENGDCMAIGSVSQPVILSHLTIGYVCRKVDQAVMPVKACDFELWKHGENQILPKDYAFTYEAGGQRYDVKVLVTDETSFYIGKQRESKFYERWAQVQVNGVNGWACVEWQYNNVSH